MAIRIRKHGTVIASFATPQEIVISHANDSISLGDGTNTVALQDVTGTKCLPVKAYGGGDASAANQTSGDQKTQITDASKAASAEIDDVGGEKALKVSVISSVGGSAAPAHTDDAAFTVGVNDCTPIGAMFDDAGTDSVDEGDAGVLRMTADRLLKVQLAGLLAGLEIPIKDNGNSITVDGPLTDVQLRATAVPVSGTFWQATQPVSAAALPLPSGASTESTLSDCKTALQLLDDLVVVDDAAFAVGSKVMPIGAVMDDTGTDTVDEGDIGYVRMTSQRQLWTVVGAISAGDNNIGNVDIVTLPGSVESYITDMRTSLQLLDNAISGNEMQCDVLTLPDATCVGKAAHDSGVSGNPIRVGGRAMLANGTAVAEDDVADIATDNQGRLVVTPHVPRDLVVQASGDIADTTEKTVISAGAAGVFHDITKIILSNSSSTACRVQIRDATAGSIVLEVALAAYGGAVIDFGTVPMKQTTAANNWTIDLQAAVTSVYYFFQAIKRIA